MSNYKRSDWFNGLLEAERLIKDGWHLHSHDYLRVEFKYKEGGTIAFHSLAKYTDGDAFTKGCMDYIDFIEENY
jgi:hypothetical protein